MVSNMRYMAAALVLKGFGSTCFLRRAYRTIGNALGEGRHSGISGVELERGWWVCEMAAWAGLSPNRECMALELGTGWTHLYAILFRLFFNCKTVLFDIQDNRQLGALRNRCVRLHQIMESTMPPVSLIGCWDSAKKLACRIAAGKTFEDLYRLLGMTYLLEPNGRFDSLDSNTFDIVFSVDVLEHVDRQLLPYTIGSVHRVLKPGGISIHQIGIDDHLSHYAPGAPSKNYLRYSDKVWRFFFENRVQYFNLVQSREFLELFHKNGFKLLEYKAEEDPELLVRITPHSRFHNYDAETLKVTRLYMVHRKPLT